MCPALCDVEGSSCARLRSSECVDRRIDKLGSYRARHRLRRATDQEKLAGVAQCQDSEPELSAWTSTTFRRTHTLLPIEIGVVCLLVCWLLVILSFCWSVPCLALPCLSCLALPCFVLMLSGLALPEVAWPSPSGAVCLPFVSVGWVVCQRAQAWSCSTGPLGASWCHPLRLASLARSLVRPAFGSVRVLNRSPFVG